MVTAQPGRFDDEMRDLLAALKDVPDDADLAAKVCYGLNIRAYHEACVELARRTLAKAPRHGDLYFELIIASSLNAAHSLEDILEELTSLANQFPNDHKVQRNLALVHYYLENDEAANSHLRQLMASDELTDTQTYEIYAQLCYTRQDFDTCMQTCEAALERPGSSARALRLKGLCHQELGETNNAETCFREALRLEPHFVWACHSMAVLAVERDDMESAFRFFGKATYINPHDPGNLFLLAEAFIDREVYHLAAAELEKLLMLKPAKRIEAEVHNALGYIYTKQEAYDDAHEQLELAIDLEPDLAVAYYNLARLALAEDTPEEAETLFQQALDRDPYHVETRVELGYLYYNQNRMEESEEQFQAALDIEPYEAIALQGLSKLRYQQHDYEDQLKFAKAAYEFEPDNADICNDLGIAYECNDALDQAETVYLKALDLDPDHAAVANNLGYLYEKKMQVLPEEMDLYRDKAIAAWKNRLAIRQRKGDSIEGAVKHLHKLDVPEAEIQLMIGKSMT